MQRPLMPSRLGAAVRDGLASGAVPVPGAVLAHEGVAGSIGVRGTVLVFGVSDGALTADDGHRARILVRHVEMVSGHRYTAREPYIRDGGHLRIERGVDH